MPTSRDPSQMPSEQRIVVHRCVHRGANLSVHRGALAAAAVLLLLPAAPARATPTGDPAAPPRPAVVYLQPLGSGRDLVADADLAFVARSLERFYGLEVRRLPAIALPRRAFYKPRERWRAEILLEELAARRPADARFVLGVTAADISTTKGRVFDWGVMGLGAYDGSAAVLSSLRTFRGAGSPERARQRLGKVAVHEIGHNLGLVHCPTRGCLMEDAAGRAATCDREYDLCPRCRHQLAAAGLPLPSLPPTTLPWPHP
jgi:archaemetzincin